MCTLGCKIIIAFFLFTVISPTSALKDGGNQSVIKLSTLKLKTLNEGFPSEDDPHFLLYTRETGDLPVLYRPFTGKGNYFNFYFSPRRPTKIIIHGWLASVPSFFTEELREAYLSQGDYNLIMVDWSSAGSSSIWYTKARMAVPAVGYKVAVFIAQLCSSFNILPEQIHIIGYSLGAHIAGIAGHRITDGSIGRITGLDPAGPLFLLSWPTEKLSSDSANFVDVIHTCAYYLGPKHAIGHADFYPNYGIPIQPGCGLDIAGVCSHQRAYIYFVESVSNPLGFMAVKCQNSVYFTMNSCEESSYLPMGEFAPYWARGNYYLLTNSEKPFARGRRLVSLKTLKKPEEKTSRQLASHVLYYLIYLLYNKC